MIGVLYTSVALPAEQGKRRLAAAVGGLLRGSGDPSHSVLWSLQYYQRSVEQPADTGSNTMILPSVPLDLGLSDSILIDVKQAWQQITGEIEGFMTFEAREGELEED